MPEPTTAATDAAPAAVEDHLIREHVKELTREVLQQGRVDPEAVRKVARAVARRPGDHRPVTASSSTSSSSATVSSSPRSGSSGGTGGQSVARPW
jgi:hypothetical protein